MRKVDIGPRPIQRDGDAVAKADQEEDVRHTPHQPGEQAGQAQPAEVDDRRLAADRGQIAEARIGERRRCRAAGDLRIDEVRDIGALLLATGASPGSGLL
jgi:hypothetical protein